nr:cystatin [Haemaphysalis flava]
MALRSTTACALAVVVVGLFLSCFAEPVQLVGGWHQQSEIGDERYNKLAHFAIAKQVEGREFFDTLLEITAVETQLVAGTNYRITFKTTESTCRVTETYTKESCQPKTQEAKDTCTAVIYEVPWLNQTSLTSFTCGTKGSSS